MKIFSATANGCLNELGYNSIFQRLQTAQRLVAQAVEDKTRLYQDNCRLVALCNSHQETFNVLQTPEAAQVNRLQELTEQARSLKEECDQWAAQHASLSQDHQKLSKNFNSLRELHAMALKDIGDLRAECARLRENSKPQIELPSRECLPSSSGFAIELMPL